MNQSVKSTLILLLAAMIWGSAFVAQKSGMDDIGPFYFSAFRCLVGSAALFVGIKFTELRSRRSLKSASLNADNEITETKEEVSSAVSSDNAHDRTLLKGGLICGIVVFFALNSQQMGLVSVDAGKSGFITALYIVLVPVFGIFFKRKPGILTWIAVALGVTGLYFLCLTSDFSVMPGDFITLISAFFWAAHIMCLGHFAPKVNVAKLTGLQFFVAGIISLITAFFTEPLTAAAISGAWFPIVYTGIFSSAIAFSLQALGQKHVNPTIAALVMSTESLFAALSGFIILGETFTMREGFGCILMFSAIIIAQLPEPAKIKEAVSR